MSKKTLIIIASILVIFLLSLLGYYFLLGDNKGGVNEIISGFKGFLPFGQNGSYNEGGNQNGNSNNNQGNGNESQNNQNQGEFVKKLRKISSEPVSGAETINIKAGTIVHYIEKATGHIYEVELFSPKQNRISNTTIPIAYEAKWGNNGNSFVAQYLRDDNDTVDTFSFTLKSNSTTTDTAIVGTTLPPGITDVSIYGDSIFYLQTDSAGSSGFISNIDGTKRTKVWSSTMKELVSQFVNKDTVLLSTKPLEDSPGYLYSINTKTGVSKRILGNIPGMSALGNTDASKIAVLSQGDRSVISIFEPKTVKSTETSLTTFPEKCVWGRKNKDILYCALPINYIGVNGLTSWYKGLVLFTDNIWKYEVTTGATSLVLDLSKEAGEDIDLIKPVISENDQYIVFMNKKDNSLWSLDLTR